jgi:hypothetical protein
MMKKMTFSISKSFGRLQLIPEAGGLRLWYVPIVNGELASETTGAIDIMIPLDAVGGLWATARAFLYGVESLDENIILRESEGDILVKLYRDKPKGSQGALSGDELCWLRIVSGRSEDERRRIKLGPRDLLCVELACNAVLALSASPLFQSELSSQIEKTHVAGNQNGASGEEIRLSSHDASQTLSN